MGNCQAIDAAAVLIQHPSGKIERFYEPITANKVMRMNQGHYVSLIMPLLPSDQTNNPLRFTRVKLLRPTDTLALGHAYRLVPTEEVMRVLRAKKSTTIKKISRSEVDDGESDINNCEVEAMGHERNRPRTKPTTKSWQPSLHSISEVGS